MTMADTAKIHIEQPPQTVPSDHAARSELGLARRFGVGFLNSVVYGLVIGFCIWATLMLREQNAGARLIAVVMMFSAGAMLGAWFALVATWIVARGWFANLRPLIMVLALTGGTVGLTAFLHFLQFRLYFAEWHEPSLTKIWLYQMAFTGFGAVGVFIMVGLRLYLPFALPVMLIAAWWFSRRK